MRPIGLLTLGLWYPLPISSEGRTDYAPLQPHRRQYITDYRPQPLHTRDGEVVGCPLHLGAWLLSNLLWHYVWPQSTNCVQGLYAGHWCHSWPCTTIYIHFPETEEEWRAVKVDFYRSAHFPNNLGAIDCTHIAIVPPPPPRHREVSFRNCEQYHSLNVQVVIDTRQRIMS